MLCYSNLGTFYGFPGGDAKLYDLKSGIYFISNYDINRMEDKPDGKIVGRSIWIYSNTYQDERVGLLLVSGTGSMYIGKCYGGASLTWNKII